jgi:hypothetical protein
MDTEQPRPRTCLQHGALGPERVVLSGTRAFCGDGRRVRSNGSAVQGQLHGAWAKHRCRVLLLLMLRRERFVALLEGLLMGDDREAETQSMGRLR